MNRKFVFSLQKALDWYRQSLAVEQAALQAVLADLRALNATADALQRRQEQEQNDLHGSPGLAGRDFQLWSEYARSIRQELERLAAARIRREKQLDDQRQRVARSHQRVQVVEKLEERRREEWQQQSAIEENALASELYLAGFIAKANQKSGEPTRA